MVIGRLASRYVKQRLVTIAKPRITHYISQEYGQIAGSIAGIALSVSVGDYYGAITGISGKFGNNPPDDRAPPFGYFDGSQAIIGPSFGTQYKALRTFSNRSNRNRRCPKHCSCKRCRGIGKKSSFRNRRR